MYATTASMIFFLFGVVAHPQKPAVDLILVKGNIRTMDRRRPRAEALAVSRGKIVAVGSNAAIRRLAGKGTRIVDAGGRLVLPGFNDAHVHFAAIGNKFSSIDLRSVRTAEEFAARLSEYAISYRKEGGYLAAALR